MVKHVVIMIVVGEFAFEFERTVSRLQEMRSTDWLERVRD